MGGSRLSSPVIRIAARIAVGGAVMVLICSFIPLHRYCVELLASEVQVLLRTVDPSGMNRTVTANGTFIVVYTSILPPPRAGYRLDGLDFVYNALVASVLILTIPGNSLLRRLLMLVVVIPSIFGWDGILMASVIKALEATYAAAAVDYGAFELGVYRFMERAHGSFVGQLLPVFLWGVFVLSYATRSISPESEHRAA